MNSDDHIIVGCLEGRRKAYSLLFKKYAPVMLGVCIRYCKNRIDAEDVMQDGFIKVFTQIRKFRQEGSFEGWVKRIMINTAIDNYKSNLKHFLLEDVSEMEETVIGEDGQDLDNDIPDYLSLSKEKLMQMVQELPDGYRVVFNLFAIENFSHREISGMLGISENTSKTQLLKARRSLRGKIEETIRHEYINRVTAI